MKHFLEVEISRRQLSTVILVVDDADPKVREGLRTQRDLWKLAHSIHNEVTLAADLLTDHEWENGLPPYEVDLEGVREISEQVAGGYGGHHEVPPPSPAELRAAQEAAGQQVLL